MNKYSYCGPVMMFNTCVQDIWRGETIAPTEKKAKSNLVYQWKKNNNRTAGAKVSLPGKIELIG